MDRDKLKKLYPHLYKSDTDINHPRNMIYLEAILLELLSANERLANELALEKEVNIRVRDVFSSWLGMPK